MTIKTNRDVVRCIARFIPPNPVVYTVLAAVNRDFYAVFTSDHLWRQLDVYNVQHGIFADFIARIPTFERLMCYSWAPKSAIGEWDQAPVPTIDNLYATVGGVVTKAHSFTRFPQGTLDKSVGLVLIGLDVDLEHDTMIDEEVALHACAKFPWVNEDARDKYGVEFGYKLLDFVASHPDSGAFPLHYWLDLLDDLDFVKHVLEVYPRTFARVILDAYMEPGQMMEIDIDFTLGVPASALLRETVEQVVTQVVTTREQVLQVVAGEPHMLDLFPQYWKDREVCLKAVDGAQLPPTYDYTGPRFLEKCRDPEVFAKMVPRAVDWIPREFCSAEDSLRALDAGYGFRTEVARTLDNIKVFCNSETIEEIVTFSHHLVVDPDFYGYDVVKALGQNRDWLAQRVKRTPPLWNIACKELKHDVELLLIALEAMRSYHLGPGMEPLEVSLIPQVLMRDHRVGKLLAYNAALDCVPDEYQTLEMAQIFFTEHIQGDISNMHRMSSISSELLLPLAVQDRSVFNYCNDMQYPKLLNEWKEHFSTGGFHYLDEFPPLLDATDRDEVARYFEPRVHDFNDLPIKVDVELVAAAVKYDGQRFQFLPPKYQQNKYVQESIGPMAKPK